MEELIDDLIQKKVLKSKNTIEAMRKMDRAFFVRKEDTALAYLDTALPIGFGQTISQPYTVAIMLEMLEPRNGQKILDVGSGSGWTTALLAEISGRKKKVIGLERVPELVRFGQNNLAKYPFPQAEIIEWSEIGYPREAPYDRILVSAAAESIPQELVNQLSDNGILVMPVGDSLVAVKKKIGFIFVPFIKNS